jgi:rRNA maturation endonuclease Nob1
MKKRPAQAMPVMKRCDACGRLRAYEADDRFCLLCGGDSLRDRCSCGRTFDYAMTAEGDLFCPRCGQIVRGRAGVFEA